MELDVFYNRLLNMCKHILGLELMRNFIALFFIFNVASVNAADWFMFNACSDPTSMLNQCLEYYTACKIEDAQCTYDPDGKKVMASLQPCDEPATWNQETQTCEQEPVSCPDGTSIDPYSGGEKIPDDCVSHMCPDGSVGSFTQFGLFCGANSCPDGQAKNTVTNQCGNDADGDGIEDSQDADGGAGDQTQTNQEKAEECAELKKYYQNGVCVDQCASGNLDQYCLDAPSEDPNGACNPSNPNYVGVSPVDNKPYCYSPDPKCEGGGTYGSFTYNGTSFTGCIPSDYGKDLPKCDIATVQVAGGGFVCANPAPDSDKDGIADNRETDTDGDGIPDASDADIDGDGVPNESDPDYKGQSINTAALEGIVTTLDMNNRAGFNQVANKVGESTAAIEKQTKAINLGLGTANQHLEQIKNNTSSLNDKIENGTGATGELDDTLAPDISVTSSRIWTSISSNPTISHYMAIPTLAQVNTCPTWTIPGTPYWEPMPFDGHCAVLEDIRPIFSALMIGLWTVMAALIFLRA